MPHSRVQVWLQRQISSGTFPANREDWYVKNGFGETTMSLPERFARFEEAVRKVDSPYFTQLAAIDFERSEAEVTLANTKTCRTEMIGFHPKPKSAASDAPPAPGTGKHILYFTGMDSLYQNCITDIAKAVQVTGASYYAFEYPGMSKLGGEVLEVNDMVNTGIALVNTLLRRGISIDDLLFQGDSFGAAIANKVKDQLKKQSAVDVRCILNNTFSTFQAAVANNVSFSPLHYAIGPVLRYTGWDVRTGDTYVQDTPYQIHINHVGDLTLGQATLARHVERTSKLEHFVDPCPEEYRGKRDAYSQMHWATLSEEGTSYLEAKYGKNKQGKLDAHWADLYLLKFDNGLGVYETFICQYLKDSNEYVAHHPQVLSLDRLPRSLESETISFTSLLTSILPSRPSLSGFFGCTKAKKEDAPMTEPQPPTLK